MDSNKPTEQTAGLVDYFALIRALEHALLRKGLRTELELTAMRLADAWQAARDVQQAVEAIVTSDKEVDMDGFTLQHYMASFDDNFLWYMEGVRRCTGGPPMRMQDETEMANDQLRQWWQKPPPLALASDVVRLRQTCRKAASTLTLLGLIGLSGEPHSSARRHFKRLISRVHRLSGAVLESTRPPAKESVN